MRAYSFAALGALGAAALGMHAGCSSGNKQGPACNPCDDAGGQTMLAGHDANPENVPYPNPPEGYGSGKRNGATPGSVMRNFKFLGYLNADKSKGLQTIALADYYDPCSKRYAMLHLTVAGVWCQPCNQETDTIVANQSSLDAQRIVVLQALGDGPVLGQGATLGDLDSWIQKHHTTFTEVLDPGLANLGGFFNAAAIPWNCDIDPRTMEIVSSGTGYEADVSLALGSIPTMPGYPVPAVCGDN
jgi:hypothetical protein